MVATSGMMRCLWSGISRSSMKPSFLISKMAIAGNMKVLMMITAITISDDKPAKENGFVYNNSNVNQVVISKGWKT